MEGSAPLAAHCGHVSFKGAEALQKSGCSLRGCRDGVSFGAPPGLLWAFTIEGTILRVPSEQPGLPCRFPWAAWRVGQGAGQRLCCLLLGKLVSV